MGFATLSTLILLKNEKKANTVISWQVIIVSAWKNGWVRFLVFVCVLCVDERIRSSTIAFIINI